VLARAGAVKTIQCSVLQQGKRESEGSHSRRWHGHSDSERNVGATEADDRSSWRDAQLSAYRHTGFWQPMDTLRDKLVLEELWQTGRAPRRV
jgi:hypothetical protein